MTENPIIIKNHIDKLTKEAVTSIHEDNLHHAIVKIEELQRKTHHIIDMMAYYEHALEKMNSQMKSEQEIEKKIINIQKVEESAIKKLKKQLGEKLI